MKYFIAAFIFSLLIAYTGISQGSELVTDKQVDTAALIIEADLNELIEVCAQSKTIKAEGISLYKCITNMYGNAAVILIKRAKAVGYTSGYEDGVKEGKKGCGLPELF